MSTRRNSFWIASEVVLVATVVSLVAALGGAPDWTLWLLLGGSALAAALWFSGAVRDRRRWVTDGVLLLPVAGAVVAAIQLVPLPPDVLGALSPRAAELREFALLPLGLEAWRAISMDLPSTARVLARALGVLGVVFVAVQLGRSEAVRRRLFVALALCGLAVALCGYGHLIAGEARYLFGLFRFSSDPPLLTPFGNRNHLAAFLGLTGTISLGLALDERRRERALGWAVAALLMGVAIVLTYSRGGVASLVATWVAVGALVLARRSGGLRAAAPWIIILATLVFAGLLAFDQLAERAQSVSSAAGLQDSKLDFWPAFLQAARAYPLVGMGRGTFELAFTPFQERLMNFTFTHPENVVLQWWAEAGVPLAVALLVLSGWVGRRIWQGLRGTTLELVAFIGLGGLVFHDAVDFSLEMLGPLTTAAVVMGLLASVGQRGSRQPVGRGSIGVFAGVLLVAVGAAWKGLPRHTVAETRLAKAIEAGVPSAEVQRLGLEFIDRHPADWYLYSLMARHEVLHGSAQNSLAWVNRVLYLRPSEARAHVAAGHALLRLGRRKQALLEFKSSFELGDRSAMGTALQVASQDHEFGRLLVAQRGWLADAYALLVATGAAEAGKRLLETARVDPPSEAVRCEAVLLLADSHAHAVNPEQALELLAQLPPAEQHTSQADRIRGFALWKVNRVDEAVEVLEGRLVKEPGNVEVALVLVDVFVATNRVPAARQVLERLRPFVSTQATRVALSLTEARLWEAEERWGKALELVQSASRTEPQRADLHYWVAALFERLGATRSAVEELQQGRRVDTPEGAKRQEAWLQKLTERRLPEEAPP